MKYSKLIFSGNSKKFRNFANNVKYRKIAGAAVAGVLVCFAVWYVTLNAPKNELSDLNRANVEALAQTGSNSIIGDPVKMSCFKTYTEAPNDNSIAVAARICDDCKLYWLTSGSNSSSCP